AGQAVARPVTSLAHSAPAGWRHLQRTPSGRARFSAMRRYSSFIWHHQTPLPLPCLASKQAPARPRTKWQQTLGEDELVRPAASLWPNEFGPTVDTWRSIVVAVGPNLFGLGSCQRLRPLRFGGTLRVNFPLRFPRPVLSHDFRLPGPDRAAAAHARIPRLHYAVSGPGQGDSRRAQGPRPDGGGADRHRQDRRIRLAAAAASDPGRCAGDEQFGACAGAGADPRTGRAGAREFPRLWT